MYTLLTPLRLVLVLKYLTNPSFIVLSSLMRRHDKSFVIHLKKPAINRCFDGDLCTLESSTDMVDFDLPQTYPIPLMWTGCDSSRLFPMSHLLRYMLGIAVYIVYSQLFI